MSKAPSSPRCARPAIASTAVTRAFQSIVGMDKEKLASAMAAFKSGARSSSIMHAVAFQLSDAEIATLAEYLVAPSKGEQAAMTWTRRKFGGFAGASLVAALRAASRREAKPRRGSS